MSCKHDSSFPSFTRVLVSFGQLHVAERNTEVMAKMRTLLPHAVFDSSSYILETHLATFGDNWLLWCLDITI